ncbi:MAG: hypothetical protein M1820_002626 [Bogoriella megaspora]|nr:MAG: hypothetical protein M1820_002626 [Bogoriella megaspora]
MADHPNLLLQRDKYKAHDAQINPRGGAAASTSLLSWTRSQGTNGAPANLKSRGKGMNTRLWVSSHRTSSNYQISDGCGIQGSLTSAWGSGGWWRAWWGGEPEKEEL